jgi:hypothetical protein
MIFKGTKAGFIGFCYFNSDYALALTLKSREINGKVFGFLPGRAGSPLR